VTLDVNIARLTCVVIAWQVVPVTEYFAWNSNAISEEVAQAGMKNMHACRQW
jgi:hypothetical protein